MSGPERHVVFAVVRWFAHGGMQRTMLRIAREVASRGHRVTVFCTAWDGADPEGIKVVKLPVRALTNHGLNAAFGRALSARLATIRHDCVVGFNKLPGLDVYYAGDPCHVARAKELGRGALYRMTPRYRRYAALEEAVFGAGRDVDILLFAPAEEDRYRAAWGTEPSRFVPLPPGLDVARLERGLATGPDRAGLRGELGIPEEAPLVLIVGAGPHTKGVDRLVRALAVLPDADAHLVWVGPGDAGPPRRLARELGVEARCHFTGPRDDVAALYRAADVLAHPARTENTGTTLLEAMFCGLPVLTTSNCGFAFHVEAAGAGRVLPTPYDAGRFAEALGEMLTSGDASTWRRNGPEYCRRTDLEGLVIRAADAILERAARGRQSSART